VLGAVPWQINRAILSVVEQLYEDKTGYKHLKLPAKESFDMPLPPQPLHAFRTTRTKGGGLSAGVRDAGHVTTDNDKQVNHLKLLQHTHHDCAGFQHDGVHQPLTLTRAVCCCLRSGRSRPGGSCTCTTASRLPPGSTTRSPTPCEPTSSGSSG